MPSMLGGLLDKGKGALEALRDMWGPRPYQRRTQGHPGRSMAMAMLHAVAVDAKRLDAMRPASSAACDVQLPHFEDLAVYLAHAWASEDGWDTAQLIAAVKAAADKYEMPPMGGGPAYE